MTEHRPEVEVVIRPYETSDQDGLRWLFARTPPWGRTYPRPQALPAELEDPAGTYTACFVAVEQDQDGEAVIGVIAIEREDSEAIALLPTFARSKNEE